MNILETLNWRHATKAMNGQKVAQEKIDIILEAARLAPTSSGLQPFEIIVVTNQQVKDELKVAANNQSVVADCSHLLVFAAWDTYTAERINKAFDLTIEKRGGTNEGFENYRNYLLTNYTKREPKENFEHAAKQAYIAFGFAMVAAAAEQVDTTPMEGFNPSAVDAILGLDKKGLKSCVLLTLGYRDNDKDWLANLVKVRRDKADFITLVD